MKEREDCRVRSAVSGAGGPIFPRRAPPIPIPPPCGVIGVPPLPPLPPLSIPPPARGVLTRSRVTSSCGDCIVRGQCGFSIGGVQCEYSMSSVRVQYESQCEYTWLEYVIAQSIIPAHRRLHRSQATVHKSQVTNHKSTHLQRRRFVPLASQLLVALLMPVAQLLD